jgi:hypothetical protein
MGNFALQTNPCSFLKLRISPWENSTSLSPLFLFSLACLPFSPHQWPISLLPSILSTRFPPSLSPLHGHRCRTGRSRSWAAPSGSRRLGRRGVSWEEARVRRRSEHGAQAASGSRGCAGRRLGAGAGRASASGLRGSQGGERRRGPRAASAAAARRRRRRERAQATSQLGARVSGVRGSAGGWRQRRGVRAAQGGGPRSERRRVARTAGVRAQAARASRELERSGWCGCVRRGLDASAGDAAGTIREQAQVRANGGRSRHARGWNEAPAAGCAERRRRAGGGARGRRGTSAGVRGTRAVRAGAVR